MAFAGTEIMGRNPQKLPAGGTLGEAFAVVIRRLFGTDTRAMGQQLGFDRKTIENVRLGKAGAQVIAKALQARRLSHDDAWEVADAILEQVLGESRSEYEERKHRELIEKTNNAISLHYERKARRQALAERADFLVNSMAGTGARDDRKEVG